MAKAFYNLLAIVGVGDMRINMFFIRISLLLQALFACNYLCCKQGFMALAF